VIEIGCTYFLVEVGGRPNGVKTLASSTLRALTAPYHDKEVRAHFAVFQPLNSDGSSAGPSKPLRLESVGFFKGQEGNEPPLHGLYASEIMLPIGPVGHRWYNHRDGIDYDKSYLHADREGACIHESYISKEIMAFNRRVRDRANAINSLHIEDLKVDTIFYRVGKTRIEQLQVVEPPKPSKRLTGSLFVKVRSLENNFISDYSLLDMSVGEENGYNHHRAFLALEDAKNYQSRHDGTVPYISRFMNDVFHLGQFNHGQMSHPFGGHDHAYDSTPFSCFKLDGRGGRYRAPEKEPAQSRIRIGKRPQGKQNHKTNPPSNGGPRGRWS
jgi:hypothetical protein